MMAYLIKVDLVERYFPKSKQDTARRLLKECSKDNIEEVTKCCDMLGPKYKQFYSYVFVKAIIKDSNECIDYFLNQDVIFNIKNNLALATAIIRENIYLVEQLLSKNEVQKKISNWTLSAFFVNNDAYVKFLSCEQAQRSINIDIIKLYIRERSHKSVNAVKVEMKSIDKYKHNYDTLFKQVMYCANNFELIRAVLDLNFPDIVNPNTLIHVLQTSVSLSDLQHYDILLNSNKIDMHFIKSVLSYLVNAGFYNHHNRLQIIILLSQYVDDIGYDIRLNFLDRVLQWYTRYTKEEILPIILNKKLNSTYCQTMVIISALDDIFHSRGIPREIMIKVVRIMNQFLFSYWEAVY